MKLFNEKETAEILKTAAKKSHEGSANDSVGLTINELEHIARESGIDPSEINKAAKALETKRSPADQSFWGGPFSFSDRFQIDHEITTTEWENMLVPIRDFFQSKGEVYTREAVYEWSSPRGTSNSALITALKENGKTKISIGWVGPLTAVPFYLPVPLVGILSLPFASEFLGLGPLPGLSFVALSIGVTFATGRWALRKHMKKGFDKLRKFATSLEADANTMTERPEVLTDQHHSNPLETSATDPLLKLEIDHADTSNIDSRVGERSRE